MADLKEFKGTPKEQFKEGPDSVKQPEQQLPTPEQLMEFRKQRIKEMEELLPFMRLQEEYNRLRLVLTEQGVLLGELSARNQEGGISISGLQGLELYMRETEGLGWLSQLKAGAQAVLEQKKQEDQAMEKESYIKK